jgi:hypothetical protein
MSDTTTAPKAEQPKLSIAEYLSKTGLQAEAFKPIVDKVEEHNALVAKSNDLVASINAAKAQDPNNVEYLDSRWKANEQDPAIAEKVQEFYAVAETYERLLSELRSHAKANFVKPPLSEDQARDAKKSVNEFAPTIAEARKALAAQFEIFENILKLSGTQLPEGGLISLLPQPDSLKNARGRKAATESGIGIYMTRVNEVIVDGVSTNRDGKGKLTYAAEFLSEKWGANDLPENRVTGEEIEEALFAKLGKPVRSKDVKIQDVTFEFEKVIKVKNGADGTLKDLPQKAVITVNPKGSESTEKADAPAEKQADATAEKATESTEAAKPAPAAKAPMKIDTRTEAQKAKQAGESKK